MKPINILRFSVLLLLAGALLQVPYSVYGGRIDQILIRAAINVAVFSLVPIVYRVWPLPGDKAVSGKRWGAAAILLFAALTIEDLHRFSYFDRFPYLNKGTRIAHMKMWLLFILLACVALVVIVRQVRFAKKKRIDTEGR